MRAFIGLVCIGWCSLALPAEAAQARPALSAQVVNDAAPGTKAVRGIDAATIKAGILLDRAGFSPGVIDGRGGDNLTKALAAFQTANGLDPTRKLDAPTWAKLTALTDDPVLTDYEITPADVKGPFLHKLPRRLEDMAKLPRLGYTNAREGLAEKFHMGEDLLAALNPGADLARAGARIVVANVRQPRPQATIGSGGASKAEATPVAAKIEVDKRERALRVLDEDGHIVAQFPASIGSTEKPAPSGSFKVRQVSYDPTYHYDPRFAFKDVKARHRFTIKPGPNNPVGAVWIDLSAPSYGIHGTPNPEKISKTQSHGCIRLTNWDALTLARMVRRGTPVDFID